jgi:hypothetical protein
MYKCICASVGIQCCVLETSIVSFAVKCNSVWRSKQNSAAAHCTPIVICIHLYINIYECVEKYFVYGCWLLALQ